jgi:hypothetical protein
MTGVEMCTNVTNTLIKRTMRSFQGRTIGEKHRDNARILATHDANLARQRIMRVTLQNVEYLVKISNTHTWAKIINGLTNSSRNLSSRFGGSFNINLKM